MRRVVHLVQRFFFTLRPGRLTADDERWLATHLSEGELDLYRAQPTADKVHSIRCARHVVEALGDNADATPVIAASALHDVGKTDAPLPVLGRVAATVADGVSRGRVRTWAGRDGWRGSMGRYVGHDDRGAQLLDAAGSAEVTVAWASGHHRPKSAWPLDPATYDLLHEADNA